MSSSLKTGLVLLAFGAVLLSAGLAVADSIAFSCAEQDYERWELTLKDVKVDGESLHTLRDYADQEFWIEEDGEMMIYGVEGPGLAGPRGMDAMMIFEVSDENVSYKYPE